MRRCATGRSQDNRNCAGEVLEDLNNSLVDVLDTYEENRPSKNSLVKSRNFRSNSSRNRVITEKRHRPLGRLTRCERDSLSNQLGTIGIIVENVTPDCTARSRRHQRSSTSREPPRSFHTVDVIILEIGGDADSLSVYVDKGLPLLSSDAVTRHRPRAPTVEATTDRHRIVQYVSMSLIRPAKAPHSTRRSRHPSGCRRVGTCGPGRLGSRRGPFRGRRGRGGRRWRRGRGSCAAMPSAGR